jgi:hypothetical protein
LSEEYDRKAADVPADLLRLFATGAALGYAAKS